MLVGVIFSMHGKTTNLLFIGLSSTNHKICLGYHNNFQDFIGTLKIFNHECPHLILEIMIENLSCAYAIPQIVVTLLTHLMIPSKNHKICKLKDIMFLCD